jgi:gliding motility-associated-like protein
MNAQVSVNQLGTYYFILRETNAICGDVYDTMEVVVSELQITATAVAPSCGGYADGEIHIDSPEAVEYSFDGGNVWVADSFDVVFAAGTYTVCGRSALGCEKCVDVDVIDPAPVTISVSNDTLICENGTAYMSATATGGTNYLFHWDHTTSTAATQDVNPVAATTYTVYAENENGCVSQPATIDVTLRPPLTGNISPWDTICPGYPTDILANVQGGIGQPYDWVWSSGETQNGPANMTISANPATTQNYTVTITDGCESTPLVMTTNIYVAPLPVPSYTVLDPEQCEPAEFTIVNTTDPSLSVGIYWLVDGQTAYVNQDTIVTPPLMAGNYDFQMICTTDLGCVDSLTFIDALNVKMKPTASFGHSPNPVQMFNTNVYFTNTSFLGYEYQWYFEQGIPSSSNLTNPQVQFPDGETGTYDVMLITTSELGCVDTMLYELIVFPEVLVYAPNTFTPDGDEFNQDWKLYIEGVDIYDFELLIYNRWGQLIWENHDPSVGWDGTFNGKIVPAGTYTWVLRTKDLMNDAHYMHNGHINLLK